MNKKHKSGGLYFVIDPDLHLCNAIKMVERNICDISDDSNNRGRFDWVVTALWAQLTVHLLDGSCQSSQTVDGLKIVSRKLTGTSRSADLPF